jgi:hypothetical protein
MSLAGAALARARLLLTTVRALPGDLAALRRLPPILPPGMIEVRTPPGEPATNALLRTRVLLLGDVVCEVAKPLLALPQAERDRLLASHDARLRQALECLGRAQAAAARLVGGACLGAGSAAGLLGAGTVLVEGGLDAALAAAGWGMLGIGTGTAATFMLARRIGGSYARHRLRKALLPEINDGRRRQATTQHQAP